MLVYSWTHLDDDVSTYCADIDIDARVKDAACRRTPAAAAMSGPKPYQRLVAPKDIAPPTGPGSRPLSDAQDAAISRIVATTPPGGRRIQQLWTTRDFPKNFVLKLEFRATPNADGGVYIRGPQLQARDYLIAGPYLKLEKFRPLEWNELVITVTDGLARCTCNGEVLEAALKVPATGPIGLEGDRGQLEYRRLRLQELP
jgi:hypothetical protein